MSKLTERDKQYIWHPYTQHKTMAVPLPIIRGEGVYLIDEDGKKYIDAISSWWTNLHGHSHPYIAQKIYEQALQLEHVLFAGCTHEPAVQLAERLIPLLPGNFSKVFYSDNGSTAVEVAIKMALQYWKNEKSSKLPVSGSRNKILALRHSYHGDTFGAMSVSERGVFTMAFEEKLFEVIFIDPPVKENIQHIKSAIATIESSLASFIYEPMVQGAGGMNMYDAGSMNELLTHLKQQQVICIADEVMTGFGRTGKLFASEHIQERPDIICLSKGLTGGSLPLAITACTQKIFEAFLSDDLYQTFFHGHSYTANPIACTAALASLDLLQKEECVKNIQYITERNIEFVNELKTADIKEKTINPRSTGTILAFEFQSADKNYLNKVKEETMQFALLQGVLLRPLGNTIYIMPPYCITAEELDKVYTLLREVIRSL
jgi:adenosylmethionine---8-amino-7-oxononanoate aminotransferase